MIDPLAQIVDLLRPGTSASKLVTASGRWAVRPPLTGPFYVSLLAGRCALAVDGRAPVTLDTGDFVLVPAADPFTVTSLPAPPAGQVTEPAEASPGVFHLGGTEATDTRMLVGHCSFRPDNAALLTSLLPALSIVRGEQRLAMLVELLGQEARESRPGRDAVLARLLEVLLIEAFRATAGPTAVPGLLRGLADDRIATALRLMHGEPTRPWTVGELARQAALSRSTFFERFRREVGVAPMEYLLGWRMAVAKDLLRGERVSVSEAARRVGYSSPSTFSVAFARQVGTSPTSYARGSPVLV